MKVLPCPFCGAKPKLVLFEGWLSLRCSTVNHIVYSARFFWSGGRYRVTEKGFWKNKSKAIRKAVEAWNIRG